MTRATSIGRDVERENVLKIARAREIGGEHAGPRRVVVNASSSSTRATTTTRSVDSDAATTSTPWTSATDALGRWGEADAVRRVAGRYVPFSPAPRSTIAVAHSPDGESMASTHGDHTVKVTACATGRLMASLEGHGRTPWVVRFHPTDPHVLASGSLDNTVIVWDLRSQGILARWDFGRSISSLAFYPGSDVLLVNAGHKLYQWKYKKHKFHGQVNASGGETSAHDAIKVLLRTTRSLRAVHFHPTGAPMLLTAEVRDMDLDALGPAYTRDPISGSEVLRNSEYNQEDEVYVARDLRDDVRNRRTVAGRRRDLNAPAKAMSPSCEDTVKIDVENAPEQAKHRLHDMLGLNSRRYVTYSMTQIIGRLGTAPVQAAYEERRDALLASSSRSTRRAAPQGATAGSDQDLPCIVKLKLWEFETQLDEDGEIEIKPLEVLLFMLPQTVLCSEMGAHFSPDGRYIATCQACKPNVSRQDFRYICELRVYSIDSQNFGQVMSARAIKAAHCLTSIQFSPTSEHVLLAYGRRHPSLCLLMADADTFSQLYTILEVFSTKDLRLVRIIPSVDDEVNAACFHPIPGRGIVYGTKEGRLRVLVHSGGPREKRGPVRNAVTDDSPLTVSMRTQRDAQDDEIEVPLGSLRLND